MILKLDTTSDLQNGPWNRRQLLAFLKKITPFLTTDLTLTINHVENDVIQDINKRFRHMDKATNILSFNYDTSDTLISGELILAMDVLKKEAIELGITLTQHYAHLLVHGILHLYGYDHECDEDAEIMEAMEVKWLTSLGFDSPQLY